MVRKGEDVAAETETESRMGPERSARYGSLQHGGCWRCWRLLEDVGA
jgi:hypothetical protein